MKPEERIVPDLYVGFAEVGMDLAIVYPQLADIIAPTIEPLNTRDDTEGLSNDAPPELH